VKEKPKEPFSTNQESKQLLDNVFSKNILDSYTKKEIYRYFKSIGKAYDRIRTTAFLPSRPNLIIQLFTTGHSGLSFKHEMECKI